MPIHKKGFNALLLEALDEGLQSTLGESGKTVVYYHFQNSCGVRREGIPEKPEVFSEFLNRLFGFGAKIIEEAILKSLCSKLGIEYEEVKNAKFTDYLRKLAEKNGKN
ncbi:MAG: hypothetical protein QXN87_08730 [Candidatus Bathyarchaeia archaeon]